MTVHRALAATLDECFDAIGEIQSDARASGLRPRGRAGRRSCCAPRRAGPGPKVVDGLPVEGTLRAHQVPITDPRDNPDHLAQLEEWMRSATASTSSSTARAGRVAELVATTPTGDRRMGANPHANGGKLLRALVLPDFTDYAIPVRRHGSELHESTRKLGELAARHLRSPTRTTSGCCAPTRRTRTAWARCSTHENALSRRAEPADRRPRVTRRTGDGGPQRAQLRGLARGLRPDRAPRAVRDVRGLRDGVGVDDRAALEVARGGGRPVVARAGRVAERAADVDVLAQRPQRLQPPGPGAHRHRAHQARQRRRVSTSRRTPTACCRSPTTASAAATT